MPKVVPEYLEHRRTQIIEAAAGCFASHGFHQTSMQDICDAAGLSPGAVYRYFKGKEDIIEAICDGHRESDLALIDGIKVRGSATEVMEALGRTFLDNLDDPAVRLHMNLLAEAPSSDHIRENLRRGSDEIIASFADYVRLAQARGEVNPAMDPGAIAQFMCACYHGFIALKQVNPDLDSNRYFDAVMAVFRGGFFTAASQAAGAISAKR